MTSSKWRHHSDVIGSSLKLELMCSTIISIPNFQLTWFYEQRIHMELVTVPMFHLPWDGTTTQENFWNLLVIICPIKNSDSKISAIFKLVFCGVDPSDWEWGKDLDDIYRLDHLRDIFHDGHPTKAWISYCVTWLADDSANKRLRNLRKHHWLPFLKETRNTLEFRNNDTHTWTNIIGNIFTSWTRVINYES